MFRKWHRPRRGGSDAQSPKTEEAAQPKKEILISLEANEIRVAVLEDGVLGEFYIERADGERLHGNIYKGKVSSLLPGIGAAFIDLGTKRDGFLYVADALRSPLDEDEIAGDDSEEKSVAPGDMKIEEFLKVGQEIVVQVVKEPIGGKGPRLTTKFTIPARYLVLMPGEGKVGISRRIEERRERDRIRQIFGAMELPKDAGFIVRTASEGKSKEEFDRDIRYLMRQWDQIKHEIRRKRGPALIHRELDLVERTIRDLLTKDTAKIVVDHKSLEEKVRRFLRLYLGDNRFPVEFYQGRIPLFERYHIDEEIEKAFQRKVLLRCGGSIVIEQTEGLVSIDVNTGKYAGRRNLEETAFKTNCEAAREIARQVRLRDMGGIIIVDFIDMEYEGHCREVIRIFRDALRHDRARTNVLKLSELGLVEMTRQRVRPSLESAVYDTCPYCEGRGLVKSVRTMSVEMIKKVRRALLSVRGKTLQVSVHPGVAERLIRTDFRAIQDIERQSKNRVVIVADPGLHVEDSTFDFI
ncbi:MAG TPA: Rne/Rng family ribonuclease [Candidatus Omnitrophota bacterium]|nr:Rne/Rng family ribonuclease [Candidatus Omnitrophota bacterium]